MVIWHSNGQQKMGARCMSSENTTNITNLKVRKKCIPRSLEFFLKSGTTLDDVMIHIGKKNAIQIWFHLIDKEKTFHRHMQSSSA